MTHLEALDEYAKAHRQNKRYRSALERIRDLRSDGTYCLGCGRRLPDHDPTFTCGIAAEALKEP